MHQYESGGVGKRDFQRCDDVFEEIIDTVCCGDFIIVDDVVCQTGFRFVFWATYAVLTQRAFAVKQTGGASVLDAVMHAHCRVVIRYVIRFHFVSLFIVLIVMYGIPPGNIRHKSRCLIVNCAAPIPMPRHNNLSHVS